MTSIPSMDMSGASMPDPVQQARELASVTGEGHTERALQETMDPSLVQIQSMDGGPGHLDSHQVSPSTATDHTIENIFEASYDPGSLQHQNAPESYTGHLVSSVA